MSCCHPITIRNPRLKSEAFRTRFSSLTADERALFLASIPKTIRVPCGRCHACLKSKSSSWTFRLKKEFEKYGINNVLFVTLTIAPEHYDERLDPRVYLTRFLDRFRRAREQYTGVADKSRIRHWFITEYGDSEYHTGRLHFHGFLFEPFWMDMANEVRGFGDLTIHNQMLSSLWKYGRTWVDIPRSTAAAAYCTKYMLKGSSNQSRVQLDKDDNRYSFTRRTRIYCSSGIGSDDNIAAIILANRDNYLHHRPVFYVHERGTATYPRYYTEKAFSASDRFVISSVYNQDVKLADGSLPEYFNGVLYPSREHADIARARLAAFTDHLVGMPFIQTDFPVHLPDGIYDDDFDVILDLDLEEQLQDNSELRTLFDKFYFT